MRTSLFFFASSLCAVSLAACSSGNSTPGPCEGACGGLDGAGGNGAVNGSGGNATGSGGAGSVTCPDVELEVAPTIDVPLDETNDTGISVTLRLNQLGFDSKRSKHAVVEASGALTDFQLLQSSDQKVVFTGPLTAVPGFSSWGSASQYYVADFSSLRTAGSFVLRVNGENSAVFEIGDDLHFNRTLGDVLGYFKGSRADDSDVWNADASIGKYGSSETHNVQGGWYDASGDISKYLSHLSYANHFNPQQIPLTAWSMAWVHDNIATRLTGAGLLDDVTAEALWGADYLVRVLDDQGYFYATVFDNWTGNLDQRQICAFEGEQGVKNAQYQAAFREGGGMAVAALARIAAWGQAGTFTSAEYLAAAQKGYAHLVEHGASYTDDGQENIIDDYAALMAASELYAATTDATQKASYLTAARARAASLGARLGTGGYFLSNATGRPFWHGSDAGLPVVALVRYSELETDAVAKNRALDVVATHLDYLLEVTAETANPYGLARQHVNQGATVHASFFMPHDNETGYWWQGENARLASLATAALLGGRAVAARDGCAVAASPALASYASDQLDWILGKNPQGLSFLEGTGNQNSQAYCSVKGQNGQLDGGISNGITGANNDGSGIQWLAVLPNPPDPEQGDLCWMHWRWTEQWLPHSTWYMMAISAAELD